MANEEVFTLDGLALNDGTTFGAVEANLNPPAPRYIWAGSVDTEGQLLAVEPEYENRDIILKIAIVPQSTMDLAMGKVAQIRDKLKKASATAGGISLVWTPATGTLSCTFKVFAGEVTDLPVDWENGWLAKSPTVTLRLVAAPYWVGTEVVYGTTATTSTPFQSLELPSIPGDIDALGRVIVTDGASKSRRHVEWGIEGPATYDSSTSLLIDSDNLTTTGFGGTQTTSTGAYDPNAAGNSAITGSVYAFPTALCGFGSLAHKGVFRVKARVKVTSAQALELRLAWRANDDTLTRNDWVSTLRLSSSSWQEVDLGLVNLRPALLGTHAWTGQIEAQDTLTTTSSSTVILDYLILVPASDGYGVARGAYSYQTGVVVAQDAFTSTTAGNNLTARVAPLGGTWATSGAATDLQFADALGDEQVSRSASGARDAILGTTTYTDVEVGADITISGSGAADAGVEARWTDASNNVQAYIDFSSGTASLVILQFLAGVSTSSVTGSAQQWSYTSGTTYTYTLKLIVYATGVAYALVFDSDGILVASTTLTTTDLATGGTLATGKAGIIDTGGAGSSTRYYDQFYIATPATEPIALYSGRTLQFRYDDTLRENSGGTAYGRPKSYEGARVRIPVGTSRVLVKARRNDIIIGADDNVTDSTTVQVAYTPRGLVVPR